MLNAPPVDLGFNLILESNQVILTDTNLICPGDAFNASFYNTYDPNGSLTWALGPLLTFEDGNIPPAGTKQCKIKLPSTTTICSPFDSWVEVSFNYSCGGPVMYRLPVHLGSTFGLNGVYIGSGGIPKTINSANSVQAGSYDLRLENPNVTYTWTQTIGSSTITLPNTSNRISFGIVTILFNKVGSPSGKGRTIEIIDPLGRLVRRLSDLVDEQCEFSIGDLSPGAYWIRINDGTQSQTVNLQKF